MISEVAALLEELGIMDNTYLFYTSDNGAWAGIIPPTPWSGPKQTHV
jgi:arylsulfatase A-like enzyme